MFLDIKEEKRKLGFFIFVIKILCSYHLVIRLLNMRYRMVYGCFCLILDFCL